MCVFAFAYFPRRFLRLPLDLQEKVRLYYDYYSIQRGGFTSDNFLNDLSPALSSEIRLQMHKEMVTRLPFLKDPTHDKTEMRIVKDIVKCLAPRIYMPGEIIIQQGEDGDEMFFISKGSVSVINEKTDTVQAVLSAGQFFGEGAMLDNRLRTATVRALGFSDLHVFL